MLSRQPFKLKWPVYFFVFARLHQCTTVLEKVDSGGPPSLELLEKVVQTVYFKLVILWADYSVQSTQVQLVARELYSDTFPSTYMDSHHLAAVHNGPKRAACQATA